MQSSLLYCLLQLAMLLHNGDSAIRLIEIGSKPVTRLTIQPSKTFALIHRSSSTSSGIVTISSSHELNWPGCDGYGTVVLTSALFRIADTYWAGPPLVVNGLCHYTLLACSTGTPTCTSSVGVLFSMGCPSYIKARSVVIGGVCLPGVTVETQASGPGPCN